ncbi:lysine-N-methylase [Brevibacillus laterosporus]|uniref:flagellin lysine-N-methylase n=1 Tax=Brevibacillus laterosporus TaxID=1465 RepID=UPI000BCFCF1D|nr:flagellin lysine-N-methylase [Brevibacillus laterosporus]PCN45460.1 lysine-N-methylase [Brevibacillus laterosporus]
MSTTTKKTLVPEYMLSFQCIGTECEDTCCAGWKVTVDQDTYKKYKRLKDEELSPIIDRNIKRVRSKASTGNYAKIMMDSSNSCVFLNEQKLCSIQLKKGEDYLCNTCKTYPRTWNNVNDVVERAATISCPEIARLALLNPEGIGFQEQLESVEVGLHFAGHIDTSKHIKGKKLQKYFWELRIFTIQVLQYRQYKFEDRLLFLGLFFQKVQEYVNNSEVDQVLQLIGSYTNMLQSGTIDQMFADVPVNHTIQMKLLKKLTDQRFIEGGVHGRYIECYTECLLGLEHFEGMEEEGTLSRYIDAYENYYQPFMKNHEYILENYLVNHVFSKLFPTALDKDIFEEYVMLVIRYALIKLQLIGMARHHKTAFSTDHVVKLIQSFGRAVEHNQSYLTKMKGLLEENGFTTMGYMSILIKN